MRKTFMALVVATLIVALAGIWTSEADASPTSGVECFVHQGVSKGGPHGNTAGAFRLSSDRHADIETDLRLSKNGIPMVLHDPNMWDVAGHDGSDLVKNYTARQLSRMHYVGGGRLLTWSKALTASRGSAVLAELKIDVSWSRASLRTVIRSINNHHAARRVFLYTSNWQVVAKIERIWPSTRTIIRDDFASFEFVKADGVLAHADFWTRSRVHAAHAEHKLAYVRKLPSTTRWNKMRRWGIDGAIVRNLAGRSRCR